MSATAFPETQTLKPEHNPLVLRLCSAHWEKCGALFEFGGALWRLNLSDSGEFATSKLSG